MKSLRIFASSQPLPGRDKRSNQSSTKDSKSNIPVSRRLFGFRGLSAGIGLSVMLVAVALSASLLTRGGLVRASSESIDTFASSDCTTPQNTWTLGQQACAVVTGTIVARRITWIAPDGSIAQVSPSFTGTGSDKYTIQTSGPLAQTGTWKVESMDNTGTGFAITKFLVTDPAKASNCDLSILKFGPNEAFAGNGISYTIQIDNRGPDAAQVVVLSEPVPSNTTFVTEAQNSGPSATCVNPSAGAVGTSACTIPSLAAGETAIFTFIYNVNAGAQAGSLISNTASVSSTTNELFQDNNSATYITSVSNAAPPPPCTITCPASVVKSNSGAPNPCSVVATYNAATTSGNCVDPDSGVTPTVVCSPPSGSGFPVGVTNVTCSSGGNTCSFTVTVNESRAPVTPTITCPSDVTVDETSSGAGSAIVSYADPTTTGNCVTVVCSPPSGSSFPVGTTAVNCTGTDSSNQTVPCSFNVTVNSTSGAGCTITCPTDVVQAADANQCSAVVSYPAATTNGPCGTVTCSPPSGSTFSVGSTPVTCVVSGGPSCSFTVSVVASTSPTITTCATDKTVTANSDCEAAIPNLVPEVQTSGCNVTVSQSPAAGNIVGPGATTVTLTAENSAGEAHCTATVTVLTPAPPSINCPGDTTKSNDAGQCGALVSYAAPTGNSPCPGLTFSCSPASGSLFPIGATTVTCTARDASGQTATCTFKVTVNDTQPPTISCPANITQNNDQDKCGAVVNYASPTAADNCPGVTSSCTPASGTEFAVGTTTVTCTATDGSNNTASCTFTVRVNDTQPPKFTCPSDIQVGTDPNSVTAIVNYHPTVSDNCPGPVTVVCTPASGSQFQLGTVAVTCTATDAANNQSSCSFNVTVLDTQPPTITCPPNQTRSNDPNQCGAVVDYPPPTVTDNQPGATASCSPPSHSFFPVGTTAVTCTATDVGGNHSSCSFTVTVRDTQAPTIVCPPNMTASNTPGQCSANVNPGTATAADNCPGVTVVGTRSDGLALGAPYPVGTTTITWTARDASGNQASCTQTITVNDTQAPTITGAAANPSTLWPPNHKMVDVAINYSLTDNCTASSQVTCSLSVTSNEGTSADWVIVDAHHVQLRADRNGGGNGRTYTITITCRDSSGNTSTTTVTVTVPHNH
jgi:uncharacterized repeat protein (TIGR01451 family)